MTPREKWKALSFDASEPWGRVVEEQFVGADKQRR